jgi:hypothetical protein
MKIGVEGESEMVVSLPLAGVDGVEVSVLQLLLQLEDITPGDDEIKQKCKANSSSILHAIVECINITLKTKHFPRAFQNGVICPLLKSGDNTYVNNYRPIPLLPIIYKILTKLITTRVMAVVEHAGALSHIHAGNISNMSCHTQIVTFLNVLKHSHRHGRAIYVMSTDVRKAFDTVSYHAFSASLEILGFSSEICRLFSGLQQSFTCTVRTPAGMSGPIKVGRGCKQGCSLSPLRFVLRTVPIRK